MSSSMPRSCAAAMLVLAAVIAMAPVSHAAPFMIVGDDEKPGFDAEGKPVINPTGNDEVLIIDLANPEAHTKIIVEPWR